MTESLLIVQRLAAVSNPQGKVEIRPPKQDAFVSLADTQWVVAGTMIRTGPDGKVTLNWSDGSRVRLAPNTLLQVMKCQVNKASGSDTYQFKVDFGRIWVRVLKRLTRRSKFEILTPTATAAVRGTIFSVTVSRDGTTEVSVLKGQVDVQNGGRNIPVRESQIAAVGEQTVPAVLEQGAEDKAEWQGMIDLATPSLRLTEPESETIPAGAQTLVVKGVAERGARVTVNDQEVKTKLAGRFETEVTVPPDLQTFDIIVRARDAKGYEAVVTRTMKR